MGCREKNRKIEVNRFFHMMNQWMDFFSPSRERPFRIPLSGADGFFWCFSY
jgi:hypothetical protein